MKKKKKYKYVIGVDEVGRGPLAGPVVVAAVAYVNVAGQPHTKNKVLIRGRRGRLIGIKDSKKLSARQREKWNKILRKNFECHCVSLNNKIIDKIGIQKAVLLGVRKVLYKFKRKPDLILLDGLLKAPKRYNQKTIIRGDEKIPLISAASIIAKVARDRRMLRLHKKYPKYCFDRHKGYGTKLHYKKIKKHGISKIHRKSFLKNIKA